MNNTFKDKIKHWLNILLGKGKPAYRVAEVNASSKNSEDCTLTIQFSGKNKFIKIKFIELITGNPNLSGFAKTDKELILTLQNKNHFLALNHNIINSNLYQIISKTYDRQANTFIYEIISNRDGKKIIKSISDLFVDYEIITQMQPTDILDVGYTKSLDNTQKERAYFRR